MPAIRTLQEIQREENVGFEIAVKIQDAERLAQIKEHMTNQTQTATERGTATCSAHQLLDILVDARKAIVAGTTLLNYGSYANAATSLEIAAQRLRLVQQQYDLSAGH